MKRMKSILKLSLLFLLCGALLFSFACGDKGDGNKDKPDDGQVENQDPNNDTNKDKDNQENKDPEPTPTEEKIEITIDLQDGSAPTTKKVKKGEKFEKPYDPSRTGFTFKEWQVDGKAYDFDKAVEAPFTITATWTMDPAVVPVLEEIPESVTAAPFAGGSVEVKVKETRGYSYTYKWYINDKNENSGGTLIEGQTGAGAALPRNLEKGKEYWVYCEVTGTRNASGATASSMSDTIKVVVEDRTISVLMVGSGVMRRTTEGAEHDAAIFLQTLARASGKGVTVDTLTVGSNYNIWESGLVGDGYLTVQSMYEIRHYDFVVLQLGRDYCMVQGSSTRNSDWAAVSNIYNLCKEMNPGVVVVPMISYARQDTSSKYYTDPYLKASPVITNREEHAAAIQAYWDEKSSLLEIPYLASDMNTLFEACLEETDINPWGNNVSDFADVYGSYLMACGLYATIFDESPVGVMCFDAGDFSVDPAKGVVLQALAAKVVLGVETETLPDVSGYVKYVDTWVDPDAPVDPKDLDPAYKYPKPTELSTYPETKYNESMEVLMFGGYPIGVYNMEKTLVKMMEREEQKKVNLTITWLGHSSESTTYNLYELFDSSSRSTLDTIAFSSYGAKMQDALNSKKLDYIIIQSGRDFTMENDNSRTNNIISATKVAILAAKMNPDVKFIIYAPYGHNANFSDFYTISNLEQHVPFINSEAEAMRDAIVNGGYLPASQVEIAYVSDAFLNYSDNPDDITNDLYQKKNVIATRANTGNRASEAGAYLAAATLYATIYDKSPVGMTYSGYAGSTTAPGVVTDGALLLKLQKTAHKTVFGTEYEGTVSTQSTLNFYTNGGSAVASITAEAGSVIEAPADPTNGDLLFAGWFYDPDFTTRFSFMFDKMPLGNTTIYGAWANKDGIVAEKPTDKTPAPTYTLPTDDTDPVSTSGDTIRVWSFGGQMYGSYNMINTLMEMIEEGTGKQVDADIDSYLGHYNENTTWNLYELFDSTVRSKADEIKFGTSNACKRVENELTNNTYDVLLIQMGRDFSLMEVNSSYNYNVNAVRKIAKLAAEKNPDVKIMLVAPYGHTIAWDDFKSVGLDNHAKHVKYIEYEAVRAYDALKSDGIKNVEIISVGSLFECYSDNAVDIYTDLFREPNTSTTRANIGNRATAKGSYLAAAGIYAAMFDKSPVGLTTLGANVLNSDGSVYIECTVDAATAAAMQQLAADYVLNGKVPTAKPDEKVTLPSDDEPQQPAEPDDTEDDGTIDLFVFGGQAMGSFGMMSTTKSMLEEGTGKDVVMHVDAYLGHNTTSTTWNMWELFASSAQNSPTDMTFGGSATSQKVEKMLKEVKFDYVILQTGRDFSLVEGSSSDGKTEYAAAKIAKLAAQKNPNVKIIIVAPYGHQATFGDFSNPVITNHETHVKYIDQEAASVAGYILSQGYAKNVEIVSMGSLFEAYSDDANTIKTDLFRTPDSETGRKNVGNRANPKGAYLAACGLYTAITGNSPVGLTTLGTQSISSSTGEILWDGNIDAATAAELQALAAKVVGGGNAQPKPIDPTPEKPQEVEDKTVEGAVNMYVFGGMTMGSYNMTETLVQMIQAGQGKPVNLVKAIPTHATTWTTYNMYELFASSARASETDMTISSTDTKNGFASIKFDYIVIQSGRDNSINSESSKTNNILSAYKLAKLAYEKNPNVQVIIVAPYGHQATYNDFTNVTVTDHTTHTALINAEAEAMVAMIKEKVTDNVEMVSIASLFEAYSDDANVIKTDLFRTPDDDATRKNVGNRANEQGSYLTACAIYAAMFDESPVGVGCLGSNAVGVDATVDVETAMAMQKLATKFVLNIEVEASTTFTVSFDTDGAGEIEAITAEMGTALTAPEAPVKAGYVFRGWYTDFGFNNEFSFENAVMPYGGAVLHAKWLTEKEATRPAYWVEPNAKEYNDTELTVLLVGSLSMSYSSSSYSFDSVEYLSELLEKGGYDAEIRTVIGNGAWNIWETGLTGENYSKVRAQLEDGKVDVIVLQAGRDYALVNTSSTGASDIRAMKGIADLAKAYNPNVKVVVDVMFGRQDMSTSYYKEFAKIGVTNRAQHSDAINKFIKENLLPSVTFDATVMSLANAFERCLSKTDINPYVNAGSDLASNEGSYLIACCMYTAITGKSPVGILRFESDNYSVKPTVGAKLQAIAAEVVLDLDNVTPAQVTDSYKERTEINVLLAGANICENDVADMLKAIAKETGKELNVVALTKAGTVEQIAADNALSIQLMYGGMEYDYIIVEAGKDNVLYDTEAANAQAAAVNAIRELALQNNKNAKVMILAPAARQNTVGQYFRDQVNNNGIATRTDYADLIEAKTKALAGETETVISYANAVEACLAQGVNPYTNSVADSLSLKGEYLAACAIYAEIFQASPATAVYVPDGITADEAAAIQNAAVMAILD
ncbi:MAG: InlB B-repeat-containing protein [Clostridia bacterium]|nr:InlB B-repeat-containing protein [Clostridia bacterium]